MWGTWWVWDARLTSVFVLFLMYLGLIALNRAIDEPSKAARRRAVLILVGFVNIPIIKFSVDWWNTLHQPASVLRLGGSAIDPEFLRPLLVMAIAFTMLFFTLHLMAMRNEIWRRRIAARCAARPPAVLAGRVEPMMTHTAYVLASYGIAAVTVLALVLWVWTDGRARRRELQALEAAGIRRRSAQAGDGQ
jgi:heme exporter protein C